MIGGKRKGGVESQVIQTLMLTAISAILLITIAASLVGYHYLRKQNQQQLATIAGLTAVQAQAAVLFEDKHAANDLLQSITVGGGIEQAELRASNGTVLADYEQAASGITSSVAHLIGSDAITLPITLDSRNIGTLSITTSDKPFIQALTGLIFSDIIVAVIVGILVSVLGSRHSTRVVRPLKRLQAVMRKVIDDGDYAQRAPKFELAEAEALGSEFNELLSEIMRRDNDIKEANAALERVAFRDELTGLPNRAMFERALIETVRKQKKRASQMALFYLDVDNFKSINDTFGHIAGDQLLAAVGGRLREWLPIDAVAARVGGDEFVLLMAAPDRKDAVETLTGELRRVVEQPISFGQEGFMPKVSIGCALYPDTVATIDELVRAADAAMYLDKRRRRSTS